MRSVVAAVLFVVSLASVGAAYGFKDSTRHPAWSLMDVARNGRGVYVTYSGGGCEGEETATRAVETPTSIRIQIDQPVSTPEGPNEACTADLRIYSVLVPLVNPIAGRQVLGESALAAGFGPFRPHGHDVVEIVPRAIRLAPYDARTMLRAFGYRVRVKRTAAHCVDQPPVIAQTPRAHTDRRGAREIVLVARRRCGR